MLYCTDGRTLKEVQLELGQSEMEELARGGGVVQDSSVCVFLMMGLEIEESQCVYSAARWWFKH